MSPVRTVYVPRFDSQQGSSHRDEPPPPSQSPREKRGNKRARGEKSRLVLKIKLPKLGASTLSKKRATKEDETPGRWTLEPALNKPKTAVIGTGELQGPGTDSDAFFFSQRPTLKATDEKKKAKLTVLRTISKMLEENRLIRQRLIALSQTK
ncbi:uncharacterized protein [Trachinotus anak]|uniref:uncharacterized protein n=1 Tax=Trachinotus anak TaxID=443729 RepID=UPI0039F1E9CB